MQADSGGKQCLRTDVARHARLLAMAFLACLPVLGAADAADPIKPSPARWTVSGDFDGRKEAENFSGAACAVRSAAKASCLLISDEKLYARFFEIVGTTVALQARIALLPDRSGGDRFKETDGEGVDFEKGRYYVIGSHGTSKKKGEYQPSRFFIYRFPVNAVTGLPDFAFGADAPAREVERTNRLEAIIASVPELKAHACTRTVRECRSLQDHGVNIEGFAVRDGAIYLGFRSPSIDSAAFVVKVAEDAVFGAAPVSTQVFRPKLGKGMGIRDLTKVRDGFLILAGAALPEDDGGTGTGEIFFWRGDDSAAVSLGRLEGMVADIKPEALLLLEERDTGYRVLVLSDGPSGGKPTEYSVPRPK